MAIIIIIYPHVSFMQPNIKCISVVHCRRWAANNTANTRTQLPDI